MVTVSTRFVTAKPIPVPGRGFLAAATVILAAIGATGTWYYVTLAWKVTCDGSSTRAAPAPASAQQHACVQLSQQNAHYAFAAFAALGVLTVVLVSHRWSFGRAGRAVLVVSVLLPIVLPFAAYAAVARPSDDCDSLGWANYHAAMKDWKDDHRSGPRPDGCVR